VCGLVGAAGDLDGRHEKAVRTMLILDSIRGEDSTGVAVIPKHGNQVKLAKQVGDPFQLFDHKSFDKAFQGIQRVIIGHNRYATTGVVSRNNAHPFENDVLVGAHNGTLNTKWKLKDQHRFSVDSEALYHHIAEKGLKDALDNMGGAWALVWWDKNEETLNLLRNKERPLWMCWSEDGKQLFWASEAWMIHASLIKAGIRYQEIFQLGEDVHISMHIDEKGVISKPRAVNAASTHIPVTYTAATNTSTKPQQTNVVTLPKKEDTTPKKGETVVDAVVRQQAESSYLSAKNRRLETMEALRDDDGTPYIPCFDPLRQYFELRLYARKNDSIWELVGHEISGDINCFIQSKNTTGKGYYKVNADTYRILAEKQETIMGPYGRLIDKEFFNKHFQYCDFCSDNLTFGADNRFTTNGECFCPGCSKDKAVIETTNLIH
jgi:asparagine synthetase B (glutamine-hydrolysing)